jgi:hypothetical protein
LLHNFRREIDFVMRRTNAGTELHDQIGRLVGRSTISAIFVTPSSVLCGRNARDRQPAFLNQ